MKKVMMLGMAAIALTTACGGSSDAELTSQPGNGSLAGGETERASDQPSTQPESEVPVAPEVTTTVPPDEDESVEEEAPVADTPDESAVPAPSSEDDAAAPAEPPVVTHSNPQVVTAMTDLVARTGVSPDAIEVVSVEEVTWSDGSIGCPQPDMRYTQAIVNGSRIILRANGADYSYHSGGSREVFYCKNPIDPVTGGGYGDV